MPRPEELVSDELKVEYENHNNDKNSDESSENESLLVHPVIKVSYAGLATSCTLTDVSCL